KPFISVVVPTRNRVDWLRRCLDGINEQDFPGYEVVIIDDGSSDDVVLAYQQMMCELGSRYRLIRANHDEGRRLGPSVVRNVGIEQSCGEYIAFCDDDDYWCRKDLLSTAVDCLQQTGAELYFSNQKILHGDEVVAKTSFSHVEKSLRKEQRLKGVEVYQVSRGQMLSFPDYAHLNISIAKKALLDRVERFWVETRYAEDVDLFVRLCDQAEGILFRPEVCSAHNAPVKHDRESASKIVGDVNRRLLESSVYWHLLTVCSSSEATEYAALSLSSNSKLLTQELISRKSYKSASAIARMAFGAKPSLKWGGYAVWLSIKSMLSRK
ncbi:MAG: glycosyltransferase family 2 protein, partial [Porticoccus sp.]|nr:glycosyltransferase family 2 protein [Porticoccus sp.]